MGRKKKPRIETQRLNFCSSDFYACSLNCCQKYHLQKDGVKEQLKSTIQQILSEISQKLELTLDGTQLRIGQAIGVPLPYNFQKLASAFSKYPEAAATVQQLLCPLRDKYGVSATDTGRGLRNMREVFDSGTGF